jgi:hypothetical protein
MALTRRGIFLLARRQLLADDNSTFTLLEGTKKLWRCEVRPGVDYVRNFKNNPGLSLSSASWLLNARATPDSPYHFAMFFFNVTLHEQTRPIIYDGCWLKSSL